MEWANAHLRSAPELHKKMPKLRANKGLMLYRYRGLGLGPGVRWSGISLDPTPSGPSIYQHPHQEAIFLGCSFGFRHSHLYDGINPRVPIRAPTVSLTPAHWAPGFIIIFIFYPRTINFYISALRMRNDHFLSKHIIQVWGVMQVKIKNVRSGPNFIYPGITIFLSAIMAGFK